MSICGVPKPPFRPPGPFSPRSVSPHSLASCVFSVCSFWYPMRFVFVRRQILKQTLRLFFFSAPFILRESMRSLFSPLMCVPSTFAGNPTLHKLSIYPEGLFVRSKVSRTCQPRQHTKGFILHPTCIAASRDPFSGVDTILFWCSLNRWRLGAMDLGHAGLSALSTDGSRRGIPSPVWYFVTKSGKNLRGCLISGFKLY